MNICLIHSVIRHRAGRAWAFAAATALAIFGNASASAQSGAVGSANSGGRTVASATFGPGTKVIPASAVRTAADVDAKRLAPGRLAPGSISHAVGTMSRSDSQSNAGPIAQVSYGCQSCMQPACHGCNTGGRGGYGYSYGNAAGSNVCGIPCNPYYYVSVDALYMELESEGGYSLSRNARMNDFDFEWMSRVTIGSLPNCVNGYEFTFVGPTEWKRSLALTDPNIPANLDTNLFDGDGNSTATNNFDGTFLDPFENSSIQTQYYNSEYWSGEVNKTLVGWDVAKVLLGARVLRVEEAYGYASQKDEFSTYADLISRTENTWIGVQAGLDLLYPIAANVYTDFRGRAGIYYNFVDAEVRLRNQGIPVIQTSRDDEEWAGVFEFGYGLRWQLGEMLAIRGGAEVWYITNAATAVGQISQGVTNDLGRRVDIEDDLLYYGGYVGAELRF